jgi:hypothetical protein
MGTEDGEVTRRLGKLHEEELYNLQTPINK